MQKINQNFFYNINFFLSYEVKSDCNKSFFQTGGSCV